MAKRSSKAYNYFFQKHVQPTMKNKDSLFLANLKWALLQRMEDRNEESKGLWYDNEFLCSLTFNYGCINQNQKKDLGIFC